MYNLTITEPASGNVAAPSQANLQPVELVLILLRLAGQVATPTPTPVIAVTTPALTFVELADGLKNLALVTEASLL